jgi:uncharacterized protein YqhQ
MGSFISVIKRLFGAVFYVPAYGLTEQHDIIKNKPDISAGGDSQNIAGNKKKSDKNKFNVGGQALIEGLLMIGPRKVAIAVRKPDQQIAVQIKPQPPKQHIQNIVFLRGAVNLFKQMKIGVSALMYSAQYMEIEEAGGDAAAVEPTRFERFLEDKLGDKAKDFIIYIAVILALCFTVGLFILLPNFIAGFIPLDKKQGSGLVLLNLLEGCIRVGIFLSYLAFSSRLQEISRFWQYHGAEHKTIHCYENGDPLLTEYIRKYSIKHPRCGTSFMFLVMIISILVFSLVDLAVSGLHLQLIGLPKALFSMAIRLLTIPLVAGAAYEVIRLSGKYDNIITRALSAPGILFQRFTTREPDDSMIEVAIAAFKNAMDDEEETFE